MLAGEIVIHAALAPDHLSEIPYIGAGFVLASVLLGLALLGVVAGRRAGWLLGAAVCVGTATLFVLSRTTGLPGFHEEWSSDGGLGVASLPLETVFLACAITVTRRQRAMVTTPAGALASAGVPE